MATTSTVPTFKAALHAALQARPGLAGVKVAYAWPGPPATGEMIAFGATTNDVDIPNMKAGRRQRDEDYVTEIIITIAKPGATPETAMDVEARSYQILGEIEDELADTPQTTPAILWATYAGCEDGWEPLDKGWRWQLTAKVRVRARLT